MVKKATFISCIAICTTLVLLALTFPSTMLAKGTGPQLCNGEANPSIVPAGAQPLENPLTISVQAKGPRGEISSITVDLSRLLGAKYYDPSSDSIKDVDVDTPMHRVYEVKGENAYLVETSSSSASIYREYRKALTHERIKETNETPDATDKWQIELPHVGNRELSTKLRVTATNVFNEQGYTSIPLQVVDDSTAPELSLNVKYPVSGSASQAGDRITIEAEATDNSSGVLSVSLFKEGAESIFGENGDLALERQATPDIWTVENTVATDTKPGTYTVKVGAVDRAGNENTKQIDIKVAEEISSLQIDLSKGWNLISVPRGLASPAVSKVFTELPVESVRTMVGDKWLEVNQLIPGQGYLVKSSEDATLTMNFEDHEPSAPPPAITFGQGWNLIGYASQTLEPKTPLNFYLGRALDDKWQVLYTESGNQARNWPRGPHIWVTDGFPTITGEPYSEDPSENLPAVEIGKGYWIYFSEGGTLVP